MRREYTAVAAAVVSARARDDCWMLLAMPTLPTCCFARTQLEDGLMMLLLVATAEEKEEEPTQEWSRNSRKQSTGSEARKSSTTTIERLFCSLGRVGRAGRPQFDTSGHGIIISEQQSIQNYIRLISHALPIDSRADLKASRSRSSLAANTHVRMSKIHRLVTVAHAAPVRPNAGMVIPATDTPLMRTWLSAAFVALAIMIAETSGAKTLVPMRLRRIAWKRSTGRMPHASMWQ